MFLVLSISFFVSLITFFDTIWLALGCWFGGVAVLIFLYFFKKRERIGFVPRRRILVLTASFFMATSAVLRVNRSHSTQEGHIISSYS